MTVEQEGRKYSRLFNKMFFFTGHQHFARYLEPENILD